MRRKAFALFSVLLLGLVMCVPVAADTSQGLSWAVQVGDQYFYNIYYWEAGIVHEDMYFNVTSNHAALPDPLTDWWHIPDVPGSAYYANGSDPGILVFVFLYAWKIAVPIGNWTLLGELVEAVTTWPVLPASVDSVSVNVDTWLHWGYTYNVTQEPTVIVCSNTYLKSDGKLATIDLLAYSTASQALTGEIRLHCDGYAPVVDSPPDIAYEQGETGHSLTWNATDPSPGGYQILKDDVDIKHGFWNSSSEEVTMNVDGLSAGSYNYTIVFYEASGISASDTVMVNVSGPTTTTSTTTTTTTTTAATTTTTADGFDLSEFLAENMLLIGVGCGVVIFIIVIVALKRR